MSPMDASEIDHIRAEGAAWLARLRSDSVRPQDHAGFQEWLAQDPRHRAAFEAITGTWDLVGGLKIARPMRAALPAKTDRRAVLAGAALLAAGVAATAFWYRQRADVYTTASGEQRSLLLADGSRLVLDTDTEIEVRLGAERREITLTRGRAYFDVAPNPHRPFAVKAGTHEIVALGTAFDVRQDGDTTSTTLAHGRIAVSSDASDLKDFLLVPGDRITFTPSGEIFRDRPDISLTMAWHLGRLGFDRETLASAVAEMNRYSKRPLVIADSAIASLTISGLYAVGDNEAFAHSVAALLPVRVDDQPGRIVLSGVESKKERRAN